MAKRFDWSKPVNKTPKDKGVRTDLNNVFKKQARPDMSGVNDKGVPDLPQIRREIKEKMKKFRRGK